MAKLGRKLKWLVFFLGHGVVSGNINYRYIFEGFFFLGKLSSNWSGVVEIDKFAVFPLLCLRNLQK